MGKTKQSISVILILTLFMSAFAVPALSNDTAYAAAKMKISKKKATLTVGKKLTLKVKNKKKKAKVKWSSSKKSVASVSKKGKVKAKKPGKTTITAKVGKKKFKCKVTVKAKGSAGVGSQSNPANPYNGITFKTQYGTMYFKLNSALRGKDAITKLKAANEWTTADDANYASKYAGTTVTMLEYDVKAVSGYDKYVLDGLVIINPYMLYDGNCKNKIADVQYKGLLNGLRHTGPSDTNLKNGQSAKMYLVMYLPNNITSFSNYILTPNKDKFWVKYTF